MMYKIEFMGTPCLQNKPKDSSRVFEKNGILTGHIPIELFQLTDYFMKKILKILFQLWLWGPENMKLDLLLQLNLQVLPKN